MLLTEDKAEEAQRYLVEYTKDMFEINVYWGNTDEFVKELRELLDSFRNARSKQ
jgi:CYTH domain-containing protein